MNSEEVAFRRAKSNFVKAPAYAIFPEPGSAKAASAVHRKLFFLSMGTDFVSERSRMLSGRTYLSFFRLNVILYYMVKHIISGYSFESLGQSNEGVQAVPQLGFQQ